MAVVRTGAGSLECATPLVLYAIGCPLAVALLLTAVEPPCPDALTETCNNRSLPKELRSRHGADVRRHFDGTGHIHG